MACFPRKFFVFYTLDSDLILGGGELKLEGGVRHPLCMQPCHLMSYLYRVLAKAGKQGGVTLLFLIPLLFFSPPPFCMLGK